MTLSLQYLGIPAPIAAKFSSRGPNVISPDVLKVIMSVSLEVEPTHSRRSSS